MIRLPYEKKVFSQHWEDGILELLLSITQPANKTFLEIGWGTGITNCCRNLLENLNFSGTGFDIKPSELKHAQLTSHEKFITLNDVDFILSCEGLTPAVFSLDIDSFDWHLLQAMLLKGFRPDIVTHEYNSHFGPDWAYTRKYEQHTYYDTKIRFGASLAAYRKILEPYYTFVTVDSAGVNAFWIKKSFSLPANLVTHSYKFHKGADQNFSRGLDFLLSVDNGWEAV
jgi:hypothetical protein